MPPRLPSHLDPPIGFAHRGARAHAPENTLEAFELAVRLGATGLESDAWLTADGVVVLDHDGVVGRVRRRPIRSLARRELPEHIPAVTELYASVGTGLDLSIDVKDPDAGPGLVAAAREAGGEEALRHLWLCHDDHDLLRSWREPAPEVRLVDSTRLARLKDGPERHAAIAAQHGIDAVNLHHTDWSGGLIALYHRFDVLAFAWDCQHQRVLDAMVDAGIDAVYCDHVDRMVEALPQDGARGR